MPGKKTQTALTIAGSDPSGGAGLQADIKVFQAMKVYGLSIPAVLTSQNTEEVFGIHELSPLCVAEQLDVLLKDIRPDALKTGMLYTTDIISAVARKVAEYSLKNFVIDPVAVSSSGTRLVEDRGLDLIKGELFPMAQVITPNIYEAGVFAGMEIRTDDDMKEAAVRLKETGPAAIIITGGHREDRAEDLFYDGNQFYSLEHELLEGEYHGTGCVFSASLTACLALGYTEKESFVKAKEFTVGAMKDAVAIGRGMKVLSFR